MATLPNPLPALAADPSGRSLGLGLPLGRLIDETVDGPWHEPLLWHGAYQVASGAWRALGTPAARAGLLPVLMDLGGGQGGPETWELAPGETSYPGDHDPEEVLAEFWEDTSQEPWEDTSDGTGADTVLAPFGPDWPGLAPTPASRTADPDTRAAELADSLLDEGSWFKDPRLALVPARRSADIPAAIGWSGPVDHEDDTARLCAVLRSWEDRFGIRVLALTFDRLLLSVAAPPLTPGEAEAVAAEHFAFCPGTLTRGPHRTLRDYAHRELPARPLWSFCWD